jgi:hypothetical protein
VDDPLAIRRRLLAGDDLDVVGEGLAADRERRVTLGEPAALGWGGYPRVFHRNIPDNHRT